MPGIRSTITIDLDDDFNYESIINQIRDQISSITGTETYISVKLIDDPISLSQNNYTGRTLE